MYDFNAEDADTRMESVFREFYDRAYPDGEPEGQKAIAADWEARQVVAVLSTVAEPDGTVKKPMEVVAAIIGDLFYRNKRLIILNADTREEFVEKAVLAVKRRSKTKRN